MKGPFTVVLEVPGQAPRNYAVVRKYEEAVALAVQLDQAYRHRRGKAFVRSPVGASSDQLQISSRGGVVRDQPELPAFGQDIIVKAQTAVGRIQAGRPR